MLLVIYKTTVYHDMFIMCARKYHRARFGFNITIHLFVKVMTFGICLYNFPQTLHDNRFKYPWGFGLCLKKV